MRRRRERGGGGMRAPWSCLCPGNTHKRRGMRAAVYGSVHVESPPTRYNDLHPPVLLERRNGRRRSAGGREPEFVNVSGGERVREDKIR